MDALTPDSLLPPLVVRNKRGRKVDETLPKSHQREVQRQFRARRAGHLLDLERRVSLLERENLILRHWAGVLPASRFLLGRGPTGCDTTKPLIADDNDPDIQLITDDASPRDRSWPPASAVPPARAPYPQEQVDGVGPGSTSQSAQASAAQQSMIPNSPIAPTAAPVYEKSGFESSPYPDARKFKPHPLYDPRSIFGDFPAHSSSYDQQVPAQAADRLLVKRESVYAPSALGTMSTLLPPSGRTEIPSHDYYTAQSRPAFSRPVEGYSSQPINGVHTEINGSNATIGTGYQSYPSHLVSWSDAYAPSTQALQTMSRRQQPASTLTPLTSVIPPVGLTSGSGASGSPPSQPTSAVSSDPDQRPSAIPAESMYAQRRSMTFVGGYPTGSGTQTPSTYSQSTMYTHQGEVSQQQQSQQQQQLQQHLQQQRQRQYHEGNGNPDSFR